MNEQIQRYSRYDTEAESLDYIAVLGPRGISVFLLRINPISRVSLCDFLFFKKELRIFYLNNRHLYHSRPTQSYFRGLGVCTLLCPCS